MLTFVRTMAKLEKKRIPPAFAALFLFFMAESVFCIGILSKFATY